MEKRNRIQYGLTGLLLTFMLQVGTVQSQNEPPPLGNQLRIIFLNPALEYEAKITKSTVLSISGGIGYSGYWEELSGVDLSGEDFKYLITPFLDLQYKLIYNRRKRSAKGKSLDHNAGNFVSLRGLWRGGTIAENINRLDSNDFMFGATWGFQRSYSKIHLLFDVGPVYYFDTMDNNGFFPFMLQLNIGLNLHKNK